MKPLNALRRFDVADLFLLVCGLGLLAFGYLDAFHWLAGTGSAENPGVTAILCGIVAAGSLYTVYLETEPEESTTCVVCGDPIHVDSGTDGFESSLQVGMVDSPERKSLGPVSIISSRERECKTVCSGECADQLVDEYREFRDYVKRDVVPSRPEPEVSD